MRPKVVGSIILGSLVLLLALSYFFDLSDLYANWQELRRLGTRAIIDRDMAAAYSQRRAAAQKRDAEVAEERRRIAEAVAALPTPEPDPVLPERGSRPPPTWVPVDGSGLTFYVPREMAEANTAFGSPTSPFRMDVHNFYRSYSPSYIQLRNRRVDIASHAAGNRRRVNGFNEWRIWAEGRAGAVFDASGADSEQLFDGKNARQDAFTVNGLWVLHQSGYVVHTGTATRREPVEVYVVQIPAKTQSLAGVIYHRKESDLDSSQLRQIILGVRPASGSAASR